MLSIFFFLLFSQLLQLHIWIFFFVYFIKFHAYDVTIRFFKIHRRNVYFIALYNLNRIAKIAIT